MARGKFTVRNEVSLAVRAGEVVALLGRSGSGKSTLPRIMAGLIQPSEGPGAPPGSAPSPHESQSGDDVP